MAASGNDDQVRPPTDDIRQSHAGLLQLVSMLGGELEAEAEEEEEEEEEEEDGELGDLVSDSNDGDIDGNWDDEDEDHELTHPHEAQGWT